MNTHQLFSRSLIYDDAKEWTGPSETGEDDLMFAEAIAEGDVITIRFPAKVMLHDECEYQLRPLEVLQSADGFYIGTTRDGKPFSRASEDYFKSHEQARKALDTGKWNELGQTRIAAFLKRYWPTKYNHKPPC
jgi:hypothetical protein